MRIKSFGCSLIFGTDLHDDGRDLPYPTPSRFTWPALIAWRLGAKYLCRARGGSGNLQIMDRIFNELIDIGNDDFYIISWSWIDRFDYGHGILENIPGSWKTLQPIMTDHVAESYYKHLHSEYRDKINSLCNIYSTVRTLEEKKVPFMMTYMDELLFDDRWHISPGITYMQDIIRPYMIKFQDKTFIDWSQDRGFEISPTLHPLEPAHAAAAELIWPQIEAILKNHSLV